MALCPDFSDSDDGAMSDDCDYDNFKERLKNINKARLNTQSKTEDEKRDQQVRDLFSILSNGDEEILNEYLSHGIDVNVNVRDGWTPLLLAASFGKPNITETLLRYRANVNLDRDGCTALMMACSCPNTTSNFDSSTDVIKLLVEYKADVKAINRKRMTALMFAANNGNLKAVQYLMPLSDKNAEDNQKWTALFWAVNNNQPAVVEYLLQEGFEYTTVDIRNNTPIDIAKYNDFHEVIKLFPEEEVDIVTTILDSHSYSFEDLFSNLKKGEKPKFFLDVCSILCGVRAESAIQIMAEKDIGLYEFMSITNSELKELGVRLPYQRSRILGGIYRFHKHPFHPQSVHYVPRNEIYSTTDMGIQLLSTIKQLVVMEASLAYIIKNYSDQDVLKSELPLMAKNLQAVQKKILFCKGTLHKLKQKVNSLDDQIKPADLITSKTKTYFIPWKKIVFSFSALSLILVFKVMK